MAIKILTSNSTLPILNALIPAYEKASGNAVTISGDSAKAMIARIRGGETGDLLVLGSGAVKELAEAGFIDGASRRAFARAIVGVGVRSGTPHPDISSVDAFRKTLLEARAIAHTIHGASGMYIPTMLEKLGIAEQMKPKTVNRPGGYIGTVVVAGEADIALQQIPELLAVPGLDCVGPVPDAVQKSFETSIALFCASSNATAAREMMAFFASTANTPLFREKGLEHVTES
ncbi:MAG: substrate-binding domain-containing protein [Burkholderiales bacterium]|jgi:molybdate transport system substrate-binding protein|nr:substrate-binding domain-containing protein [Burkholderiales bacterium]